MTKITELIWGLRRFLFYFKYIFWSRCPSFSLDSIFFSTIRFFLVWWCNGNKPGIIYLLNYVPSKLKSPLETRSFSAVQAAVRWKQTGTWEKKNVLSVFGQVGVSNIRGMRSFFFCTRLCNDGKHKTVWGWLAWRMRGLAPQLEETRCFSNLAAWQQIFSLSFVSKRNIFAPSCCKNVIRFFVCLFVFELRREIGSILDLQTEDSAVNFVPTVVCDSSGFLGTRPLRCFTILTEHILYM